MLELENGNMVAATEKLAVNISGGSFGEDPSKEDSSIVTIADGLTVRNSATEDDPVFVLVKEDEASSAVYELVKDSITAEAEPDKTASVWKVTVSTKGITANTLSVKVNGNSRRDGNKMITGNFTNAQVVFGVVVSADSSKVENMAAVVNGDEIPTTAK